MSLRAPTVAKLVGEVVAVGVAEEEKMAVAEEEEKMVVAGRRVRGPRLPRRLERNLRFQRRKLNINTKARRKTTLFVFFDFSLRLYIV